MKKYLTGTIAIIMAVSAFALPKMRADSLYWYTRNGLDNYSFDRHAEEPSVPCLGSNVICAKGFASMQTPSSIDDDTPAVDRTKNQ